MDEWEGALTEACGRVYRVCMGRWLFYFLLLPPVNGSHLGAAPETDLQERRNAASRQIRPFMGGGYTNLL